MKFRLILVSLAALLIFAGCKKEEGEGGKGIITGKVFQKNMNGPNLQNEFYSPEVRVYIIYGSEEGVYHDDMRTDFEGRYKFEWLRPGTYTVYAYSECRPIYDETCPPSWLHTIKQTATISRKEIAELEDIVILNY
jgi:hypothetical protein